MTDLAYAPHLVWPTPRMPFGPCFLRFSAKRSSKQKERLDLPPYNQQPQPQPTTIWVKSYSRVTRARVAKVSTPIRCGFQPDALCAVLQVEAAAKR